MTSGQETERVYSFNPGVSMGLTNCKKSPQPWQRTDNSGHTLYRNINVSFLLTVHNDFDLPFGVSALVVNFSSAVIYPVIGRCDVLDTQPIQVLRITTTYGTHRDNLITGKQIQKYTLRMGLTAYRWELSNSIPVLTCWHPLPLFLISIQFNTFKSDCISHI